MYKAFILKKRDKKGQVSLIYINKYIWKRIRDYIKIKGDSMKKLYYTQNIQFDMHDWERESIERIFAGTDCIMAITSDGRTLQKTTDPRFAPRTQYWTRVRQLAVSRLAQGHAIGLISDGTCMIAKRFVRYFCDNRIAQDCLPFDLINNEVKSWTNIKQVAVTDSFFGLDQNGRVHMAPLSQFEREEYAEVESWTDIVRVVTGSQHSVFGITKDGNVLCAGHNLTKGPKGDVRSLLAEMKNVIDICATGSECEEILIAYGDGTITNISGEKIFKHAWSGRPEDGLSVFQSHFNYEVIILDERKRLLRWKWNNLNEIFKNCSKISSFAIGDVGYGRPFVLAVAED